MAKHQRANISTKLLVSWISHLLPDHPKLLVSLMWCCGQAWQGRARVEKPLLCPQPGSRGTEQSCSSCPCPRAAVPAPSAAVPLPATDLLPAASPALPFPSARASLPTCTQISGPSQTMSVTVCLQSHWSVTALFSWTFAGSRTWGGPGQTSLKRIERETGTIDWWSESKFYWVLHVLIYYL